METTLATNITFAQLIKAMRMETKALAESTYAYTDLLEDIQLLAEHCMGKHSTAVRLRIYWGVRKNGTVFCHNTVQIAKWAATQQLENEAPQCYRLTCENGMFTITKLQ